VMCLFVGANLLRLNLNKKKPKSADFWIDIFLTKQKGKRATSFLA